MSHKRPAASAGLTSPAALESGGRRPSAGGRLLLLAAAAVAAAAGLGAGRPMPHLPAVSSKSALLPAVVPAVLRDTGGLSPRALAMALDAISCARARGVAGRDGLLTIIDYSLPSTTPRLWVLDLLHGKVLFHELVAHGAGSGDNYATRFSNAEASRKTSLGLFLTADTYQGGNGYSLRLRGLDAGVNDRALERNIVMHGAWYVSSDHARQYGRLGRSWGCPALPLAAAPRVIDTIKGGSFLFSYSTDDVWLRASAQPRCTGSGGSPETSSQPAALPAVTTALQ